MARKFRIPSYRQHCSGQARVTLDGKDYLLGEYGSSGSKAEYNRLIQEWLEQRKPSDAPTNQSPAISLNELILAFWKHATEYYGFEKQKKLGYEVCFRQALKIVRELYGRTSAEQFGPKRLKECRDRMIHLGWSRSYINAQVGRVRQMFRWAVEEELIAAPVYQALKTVKGLTRGKTRARETPKVTPVSSAIVEKTLAYLPATIAAMVRFQHLTGCRPGEACSLRPIDVDTTNPKCWVYAPPQHKTKHHGQERLILIGPKAQDILAPYFNIAPEQYCFSPIQAENNRHAHRRANRKTPMTPSQARRTKQTDPKRPKRECYDVTSYRNAIYRACDKAFPRLFHLPNRKVKLRTDGEPDSRKLSDKHFKSGRDSTVGIPTSFAIVAPAKYGPMALTSLPPCSGTAKWRRPRSIRKKI